MSPSAPSGRPPAPASSGFPAPPGEFLAYAVARLRRCADLPRLIQAARAGQIPPSLEDERGLPVLSLVLEGWHSSDDPEPSGYGTDPGQLARFVPGEPWDGRGLLKPSEELAAALLAAGAPPFPQGRLVNLETALRQGAVAMAVSLLACPQCPDLGRADPKATVLRAALEKDNLPAVRALLEKGVDPNADDGVQPAWFAARSAAALELVLDAGANPGLRDSRGAMAPVAWGRAQGWRAPSSTAQAEMGRLLAKRTSGSMPVPAAQQAAFLALDGYQVGPLRTWLRQAGSLSGARRPVEDVAGDEETLVEAMLRVVLVKSHLSSQARTADSWFRGPSPFGLLRVFLEHPGLPDDQRAAVALVTLAYGQVLAADEKGARRAFATLEPKVRAALSCPEADATGAWALLGEVFRRIARVAPVGQPPGTPRQPFQEKAMATARDLATALASKADTSLGPWLWDTSDQAPRAHGMLAAWAHGFSGLGVRDLGCFQPLSESWPARFCSVAMALAFLVAEITRRNRPPAGASPPTTPRDVLALARAGMAVDCLLDHMPQALEQVRGLLASVDAGAGFPPELGEIRSRLAQAVLSHELPSAPACPRPRM